MQPIAKQTDAIVSKFTKDILGLARKKGVNFAYAGNKGDTAKEVNRVMRINTGVVRDLLKKQK